MLTIPSGTTKTPNITTIHGIAGLVEQELTISPGNACDARCRLHVDVEASIPVWKRTTLPTSETMYRTLTSPIVILAGLFLR